MNKLKLFSLATAFASIAIVCVACGDDDNGSNPNGDAGPDGNIVNPDDGGPGGDGSTDGGGDAGVNSLPAYVQDQITNHTSNTTEPDPPSVWDGLADDPAFVFPASFF